MSDIGKPTIVKTCAFCGKDFKIVVKTKILLRKKYCSHNCKNNQMSENFRLKNRKNLVIKTCLHCEKVFNTRRHKQKYCSEKCWNDSDEIKEIRKTLKKTDKYKQKDSKRYQANKEEVSKKAKIYRKTDRYRELTSKRLSSEKYKNQRKNYRSTPEYKKRYNEYTKNKRATDPLYNLTVAARNRIAKFLKIKDLSKNKKTFDEIGCTPKFLKEYLEKQFHPHPDTKEEMTWKNHRKYGWHIDHRIPLAKATTPELRKKLFHYTNLQPMWWEYNLKKGDKYEGEL